jgi:hypothetical protein
MEHLATAASLLVAWLVFSIPLGILVGQVLRRQHAVPTRAHAVRRRRIRTPVTHARTLAH